MKTHQISMSAQSKRSVHVCHTQVLLKHVNNKAATKISFCIFSCKTNMGQTVFSWNELFFGVIQSGFFVFLLFFFPKGPYIFHMKLQICLNKLVAHEEATECCLCYVLLGGD